MHMKKRIYMAIVLIMVMAFLPACSMAQKKHFQASKELAGDADLFEDTDGLEKIEDDLIPEFVQALNEKYTRDSFEDLRASLGMAMDFEGDVKGTMDIDLRIEYNSGDRILLMYGNGDVTSDGKTESEYMEQYIDLDKKVLYFKNVEDGDSTGWIKEEADPEIIPEKPDENWKLVEEKSVLALYQDPETKAYAVQLDPDDKTFRKAFNLVFSDFEESFGGHADLDKKDVLVTLDEGLALTGAFIDITDSFDVPDAVIENAGIRFTLTDVNTGLEVKIPKEAKSASLEPRDDDESTIGSMDDGADTGDDTDNTASTDDHSAGIGKKNTSSSSGTKHKSGNDSDSTQSTTGGKSGKTSSSGTTDSADTSGGTDTSGNSGTAGSSDSSKTEKKNVPASSSSSSSSETYKEGDQIPVTMNGFTFYLGDVTLGELLDNTGFSLKKDSEGKVVNKDDSESVLVDLRDDDKYLYIAVENWNGDTVKPAEECIVYYLDYTNYDYIFGNKGGKDDFISVGGLMAGSSKEEMTAAFGTDYEENPDSPSIIDYEIGDYNLTIFFDDDVTCIYTLNISDYGNL